MVISNSRKSGLFAELTTVIRHLKKIRDEKKTIYVDWNKHNSLYYENGRGENVWEYFFEQIDGFNDDNIDYILNDYIGINPIEGLNLRQTFNKIFIENIKLKPIVQNIIDSSTRIVNNETLGLHLRKTDKFFAQSFNEPMSLPVNDDLVLKLVDEKLKSGYKKIFLSTDCSDTYENFNKTYGNLIINVDRIRGYGSTAIHTNLSGDGYTKGLEAIVDCYMLSKCGFLIRSTSNLSSFSMFLNLDLECININELYRGDTREHEFNIYSKI